jgi:7-dehydrocholesterol reductase
MPIGVVMEDDTERRANGTLRKRLARGVHTTVLPAAAILACPPFVMLVWYTHVALGGSISALFSLLGREGLWGTLRVAWGPYLFGSPVAWSMLAIFVALELALLRFLPGRRFEGPRTPEGNVPVYVENGFLAFATTLGLFALGSYGLGLFSATVIYDHFGALLGASNVASVVFCLVLYVKGRVAPSSSDAGTSENPVFDYYWGVELYPRMLGVNVKQLTNCRLGMMSWPLILVSFAAKQDALHGFVADSMLVAVSLQLLKMVKFFSWERGYLFSLDIMHDRAGFYICWGCLVWVPAVYTASTLYLVGHPNRLGPFPSTLVFVCGALAIGASTLADRERRRVRDTGGKTTVWGAPPVLVRAPYVDERGVRRENLLLASGFWGIARHFHYVPEVLAAVFWTLPVGFEHALPWFYVVYITILLVHRAVRDDARCARKYGEAWDEYKRIVPYRIVPKVF